MRNQKRRFYEKSLEILKSIRILAETPHWIAVEKPPGWTVEPHPRYPSLVAWWRRERNDAFVGVVHRLDRPVSGIVLLAKKRSALRHLNDQFARRRVQKFYEARTTAAPPAPRGKLQHFLRKNQPERRAELTTEALGKRAELRYRLLDETDGVYRLEVTLLTGRFHQIRAQLAAAGAPILGDVTYGGADGFAPDAIALRAVKLVFTDPATQERRVLKLE